MRIRDHVPVPHRNTQIRKDTSVLTKGAISVVPPLLSWGIMTYHSRPTYLFHYTYLFH